MASLSIPPPAGPTSTRLDWGHTGERSSSTPRGLNRGRSSASRSDRGRGGRGGRRGGTSARGARGRGSPPTEKSINTPTSNPKSAPSIVSAPSQTSNASKNSSSSSLPQPLPSVDIPERSKDGPRRAPQHAVDKLPSLTVEPASPTSASAPPSASTTSSKMSTRRRRSNNKPSGATISSRNSPAEALAPTVKAGQSRSGPSSPHPKASPPRDASSHLSASPAAPAVSSSSSSAKTNIDSLVEHVRALAMDHRPSTPSSHIDWADEDDSLPDLDDWGVPSNSVASANPDASTTASIEKAQLQLMSPILDDSLKQLPHSFDKASRSPSVGSGSLSPNIANKAPVLLVNGIEHGDGAGVAEAPLPVGVDKLENRSPGLPEPLPQSGPASPPTNSQPLDSSHPPEQAPVLNIGPSRDTPPHLAGPTSELPAPTPSTTSPVQSGRSLADSIHAPSPGDAPAPAHSEARVTESAVDISERGSSAPVNAPAPKSSEESEIGPSEGSRPVPLPRNPTHGRSHTVGRPSGGKRSFFSGSSTPAGVAAARGPHHGRTQSSPVTHRKQHSRPVITMDAMTRLAKTLGPALPKREVAATNSATSSE